MLNIPMKTKGAIDSFSLNAINSAPSRQAYSAQNVITLNQAINNQPAIQNNYNINNTAYDNAFQNQTVQNQTVQNQMFQNQTVQSQMFQNQAVQNQMFQNQTVQSQMFQNQTVHNQTVQSQMFQNQPAPVSVPVQKQIPNLLNPLQKGQKVNLSSAPLSCIEACFGWNTTNALCDVDVSAFLLGDNGKVIGDSWFVFYGQTKSPDNSVQFYETTQNDCESVQINLQALNSNIKKIVFVLTINEAFENNLNFSMMKDAYVRIMDKNTNTELVSFKMTDYYSNVISMMIGEIYLHNGIWKFNAIGNGVAKDLAGLCELYGVQVI